MKLKRQFGTKGCKMNDRFKFRVWWEKEKRYRTDIKMYPAERFCQKEFIVEQCVGLKDKNGTLIYENDIVLGATGFKYCIIWSEMELGWTLQNLETKLCIAMNAFTPDEIEIIGNIHEQAEQKDK